MPVELVSTHLRFDQYQINEENDKVVLNVFVCKPLAAWALRQSDAFPERAVIGFAVCRIQ